MKRWLERGWVALRPILGFWALLVALTNPFLSVGNPLGVADSIWISAWFIVLAGTALGLLDIRLVKPWRIACYSSGGLRVELGPKQFWTRRGALRYREALWGTPIALAASSVRVERVPW